MNADNCGSCKFGYDSKPGGGRPARNNVWCAKRGMPMARTRAMPCFTPLIVKEKPICMRCRHAKGASPDNSPLKPGHLWCAKRRLETPKQRSLDCFEARQYA